MRVLVFSHEYPPIGGGGGRVAQDLCRGLAARGHELRLITAAWKDLPARETQDGVEIYRLESGRKEPFRAGLGAMAGYDWAALRFGLSMARAWRPEVIHVHFAVPAGPVAWGIHRLTGIPYILTAHLGDVPGGTPEKTGKWFRWIYPFTPPIWREAAQVVAVSGYTRELAVKSYPVPVEVIYNGVDLAAFDPGEIAVHAPPLVVFAGRFMPQKNPLQVVRALAGASDLPWHCAMLGDGPLRAEVEAEIERAGLRERFTLPGWVQPDEVQRWFARADLLFMPSLSEGLPVVGVQALASGLALLTSRIGGWVDLVEEGVNGYMIPAGDEASYIRAARQLLADPTRLLAYRCASREIAARFDLDKIVGDYEQVFRRAAG